MMIFLIKHKLVNHWQRGFNLVEAAIVLGVVGLIIGGIWIAANMVNENRAAAGLSQSVASICARAGNVFPPWSAPAAGAGHWNGSNFITEAAKSANLVPGDWILQDSSQTIYSCCTSSSGGKSLFYDGLEIMLRQEEKPSTVITITIWNLPRGRAAKFLSSLPKAAMQSSISFLKLEGYTSWDNTNGSAGNVSVHSSLEAGFDPLALTYGNTNNIEIFCRPN